MSHVTIMGPDIDHKHSLFSMLQGGGYACDWIPDSHSRVNGRPLTRIEKLARAWDQLTYTRNKPFIAQASQTIQSHQSKALIAYWGTTPLSDIIAIKRQHPHLKTILMVLCYPVSITDLSIAKQNWMMRHAAPWIDAVMVPTAEMGQYFREQVLKGGDRDKVVVIPPGWPSSFQPSEQQTPISPEPNLIFVGRTDLSHHTVHAADDLRPLMREIVEAGIALHHAKSAETDDGHPLRRPFAPLKQKDLVAWMSAFDASLIAYNTSACKRPDRFDLTVPDRLLSSVAAGVPIAIPKQGYSGSKSYLKHYPAVFEFESARHLFQLLSDRGRVAEARSAAWEYRRQFCAESFSPQLTGLLGSLI